VKLTPEQQFEAADLYRRGLTLLEISRCLPAGVEQIRRVVRKAGVRMRRRGPRPGRATKAKGNS
jgi:hypothetical protein